MQHRDAPAGKETKYAVREWERRFLLAALPAAAATRVARIADRYVDGTRIRLRRSVVDGPAPTYKLTQKIPAPDGRLSLTTTMYLDEPEYTALTALPAGTLTKTRHSVPPLGVDVFDGPLAGLVLAEAEFAGEREAASFDPPLPVVAEVTADLRFSGGRLARTSPAELAGLLAEFGL